MTRPKTTAPSLIDRVGTLGDLPSDSHELKQQHRFLIYMALLMSGGGLLWGTLSLWFGFWLPSTIPFGYVIFTTINLLYFRQTKRFEHVRFTQVSLSLLLPVIFQLSLGGFVNSGAVMLWSLLALGGSLTFSDFKLSCKWLLLYVGSVLLCGLLDERARSSFELIVSPSSSNVFFVVNISVISSIFFVLILLILRSQREAQTELIQAHEKLSSSAEELENRVQERTQELKSVLGQSSAIVENLIDGLIAFDSSGELKTYNKAFIRLLRLQESQAKLKTEELPHYISELKELCLREGEVFNTELCLNKDQTLMMNVSPVLFNEPQKEQGAQGGCVVLIRDISSERKLSQVEEQLAISEKMSALGTLAAGIAHEINNPLTYVMSNLEMMSEDLRGLEGLSAERHHTLKELSAEAIEGLERIAKIVQELRSFMRSSERSLREVKLNVAIKSGLSLASAELKHCAEVIYESSDQLSSVFVDERQLVQVLVNLFINASQAFDSPDLLRNKIWVKVSDSADQMVKLEVRDNGSGMSPEVARQAFDPFFTTKTAVGTGLGLSICHKLINGFGGSIEVDSELGHGTTFTIMLPRFQPDRHVVTTKKRPATHRAALEEVRSVVVIDDEPSVGQMMVRALGEERVRFFTDPREGLMEIDRAPPQVIICDIMMPVMSGVEVYAALKERGLAHRTLMVTGGSAHESVAEFLSREAPPILYKPFKPSELRERVCVIARVTRSFTAIDLPEELLSQTRG